MQAGRQATLLAQPGPSALLFPARLSVRRLTGAYVRTHGLRYEVMSGSLDLWGCRKEMCRLPPTIIQLLAVRPGLISMSNPLIALS